MMTKQRLDAMKPAFTYDWRRLVLVRKGRYFNSASGEADVEKTRQMD